MESDELRVVCDRYSLVKYWGPPEVKDGEVDMRFRYILSIPYSLGKKQMETIVQMVSLFEEKTYRADTDGVELVVPQGAWWK